MPMKWKITISLIALFKLNLHAQTLVKDFNSGKSSSNPFIVGNFNGGFILTASTATYGTEYWFSDGTDAGTILLKDINPGPGSGTTTTIPVVMNGFCYFVARTASFKWSLWKTNGTTVGTEMVKDLGSLSIQNPNGQMYLTVHNNKIFFAFDDQTIGKGKELWISDGTTAGTVLLKDINSISNSDPSGITAYGNHVYFFTNTSAYGNELWRSDGTDTGTVLFKDIKAGIESSFVGGFPSLMVFKNKLFFGANGKDSDGVELWYTDGTPQNTKLFMNINSKLGGASNPGLLFANNNLMFFRASNGNDGLEPWITDGTVSGTKQLMDIYPGSNGSTPSSPVFINNKIVFNALSINEGSEAYITDGTPAGTSILKDIIPGTGSSYPFSKVIHKNTLYFYAVDSTSGTEIWQSDGTPNGTKLALDINPGKKGSNVNSLFSYNNDLYFGATVDKDSLGQELYKYTFKTSVNRLQNSAIKLFPNPINNGNEIQIDGLTSELNAIHLFDSKGKLILTANSLEQFNIMFKNNPINSGIYCIHLVGDEMIYDVKVLIE